MSSELHGLTMPSSLPSFLCLTFDFSLPDSLEPNVVDEVRTGKYRSLFHPESEQPYNDIYHKKGHMLMLSEL